MKYKLSIRGRLWLGFIAVNSRSKLAHAFPMKTPLWQPQGINRPCIVAWLGYIRGPITKYNQSDSSNYCYFNVLGTELSLMIPLEDFPLGLICGVCFLKNLLSPKTFPSFSSNSSSIRFHSTAQVGVYAWLVPNQNCTLKFETFCRQWLWHFSDHFLSCNKCPTCIYQASLALSEDVQNQWCKCHETTNSLNKQKQKFSTYSFAVAVNVHVYIPKER